MVAGSGVAGKTERVADAVSGENDGDLLLLLARGEARAERLSDVERASIAVETPISRAVRWATSTDSARHLALIGPAGTGKTFAARAAAHHGVLVIEIPDAADKTTSDAASVIAIALREGRRILITARPEHLRKWIARDDLDDATASLLRQAWVATTVQGAAPDSASAIDVLDLSNALMASGGIVDELLRRAASLALSGPPDAAREAASTALRSDTVRAWVDACARHAERRLGPLTISELWRFVATLACGALPARGRGYFDLAESVAGRLMRHEYMPEALRVAARTHAAPTESALAAMAGFDGDPSDLYCSSPQSVAGQAAIFLAAPPSIDAAADDYLSLLSRVAGEARLNAHGIMPAALADSLLTLFSKVKGASRRPAPPPDVALCKADVALGAAQPNSFTRRAFGESWVASLELYTDCYKIALSPRAYTSACDLAVKGSVEAVARHPDIVAWLRAPSDSRRRASPPAATFEAGVVEAPRGASAVDVRDAWEAWKRSSFAARPVGLLFTLGARGALDDAIGAGGAFRVSSPADLATSALLSSNPEHVERWRAEDAAALGAHLREFREARAKIVDVLAKARSSSTGSQALDACLTTEALSADGVHGSAAVERYLNAYASLMEAAVAASGDVLERALMLDVAFCPTDAARRARLMPLHPLMISRLVRRAHGPSAEDLPPVIAARHQRLFALYAEGEPGFYHAEPERWPSVAEQRCAVRDATRAWLARADNGGAGLDVDLIDARFSPPLLEEIAKTAAAHALESGRLAPALKTRVLATSLQRAAWLAPFDAEELDGVKLSCDPSIRSASEARSDALVFAIIPAPHNGRSEAKVAEGTPRALTAYSRALMAARIDPRPHKLEPSSRPPPSYAASISWETPPSAPEGRWRLDLRGDLAPPPQPKPTPVGAPRAHVDPAQDSPLATTFERSGAKADEPNDAKADGAHGTQTLSSHDAKPQASPAETTGPERQPERDAAPQADDREVVPIRGRRWTRQDLRGEIARSFGRSAYSSDESLIADVVRGAVAARRITLRHVLVRDVSEGVSPVIEAAEAADVVARVTDALIDLGDLVPRRSSARGPFLVELASAAWIELPGSGRALLLGRAEAGLSEGARAVVEPAGMLRTINLARARDAREELRFRGAIEISWEEWTRTPQHASPEAALGARRDARRFDGKLDEYDVFDPMTRPNYYRGRIRHGELERVLNRDRWAVAARDAGFGEREYRLFRSVNGEITCVDLKHPTYVELAAACAARAGEGHRFMASDEGGVLRVHFPPPTWLARVLTLATPVEPGDALLAWRVPEELRGDLREALKRALWCDFVSR